MAFEPDSAGPHARADAVLDTNVVLDLWVFQDPHCQALREALAEGRLRWVATTPMLDELGHVLRSTSLQRWCPAPEDALQRILPLCTLVLAGAPPAERAPVCTDPDDQIFIDLAWRLRVPWLFSRDRALLKLARRSLPRGVRIVGPQHGALARAAHATTTPHTQA